MLMQLLTIATLILAVLLVVQQVQAGLRKIKAYRKYANAKMPEFLNEKDYRYKVCIIPGERTKITIEDEKSAEVQTRTAPLHSVMFMVLNLEMLNYGQVMVYLTHDGSRDAGIWREFCGEYSIPCKILNS